MHQKIPSLSDIKEAHIRIEPFINKTPVLSSSSINELIGAEIYLKCENFQKVGAFKMRGATNAIMDISPLKGKTDSLLILQEIMRRQLP
jgi:threonine dehydratase